MQRRKKFRISVGLVLAAVLTAAVVPWCRHARKTSQRNLCINNMRLLWAAAISWSLDARIEKGHTFTMDEFGADGYWGPAFVERHGTCPACKKPYPPFNVLEGPVCPCGHPLPPEYPPPKPWTGSATDFIRTASSEIPRRGMQIGSRVLLRLTPALFDDSDVREYVLSTLRASYTNEWDADVVGSIADVLGKIRDARAVETLVEGLTASNWYMRMKVVESLGEIGDITAADALRQLTRDENERVRKAAADALTALRLRDRAETGTQDALSIVGAYMLDKNSSTGRLDTSSAFMDFSALDPKRPINITAAGANSVLVSYSTESGGTATNIIAWMDLSQCATPVRWISQGTNGMAISYTTKSGEVVTNLIDRGSLPWFRLWIWDGKKLGRGWRGATAGNVVRGSFDTDCRVIRTHEENLVVDSSEYRSDSLFGLLDLGETERHSRVFLRNVRGRL